MPEERRQVESSEEDVVWGSGEGSSQAEEVERERVFRRLGDRVGGIGTLF